MRITRIKAENLFSWEKLDIKFEDGTYSLTGENGCGKSSIFEIITWIGFKKTTKKNVKGDYGKNNGWGELEFDNGEYVIRRNTKEPMRILVNGEEAEQDYVDNILGCHYDTFMASIMCNQKRVSSFINEKTDTGKARIFGEMLGAGSLDKIRSKVSKRKNERELEFEGARSKFELLTEQVDTAKLKFGGKTPKQYKAVIERDKGEYHKLVAGEKLLQDKVDKAYDIANLWRNYESSHVEYNKALSKRSNTETELKESKDKFDTMEIPDETGAGKYAGMLVKADKIYQKLSTEVIYLEADIQKLEDIKSLGEGECPTCGEKVTIKKIEHIQGIIDRYGTDLYKLEEKRAEIDTKVAKIKVKLRKMKEYEDEWQESRKDAVFLQRIIDNLPKIIKVEPPKQEKMDVSELKSDLARSRDKAFELKGGIRDRVNVLKGYIEAERSLKAAESIYRDREKEYYVAKWLFTSLPLIKLMFIEENKMVLENAINEYLSTMNVQFMVKIDTQKEMKSRKEIKDEFSFQILSSNRKVDKADLSGGEETIILLATQFAINDLINPNLKLEIYDEIYGALSDNNVSTVVDAIKDRGESKQIFTISHKPEISNSFDSSILIKKNEEGSYVERI